MADSEVARVRQRLQDRLAEIAEDMHKIEAKNADLLEKWQLAREAAADNVDEPDDTTPPEELDSSDVSDDERIEAKARTSALIERLELVRPEGMADRGVLFRGR